MNGAPNRRRWRRHNDAEVAAGLAAGLTQREAGARGNMSEREVRRRLADPAFRALVDRFRTERLEAIREGLAANALKANTALGDLLDTNARSSVRLGAVRCALENFLKYSDAADRAEAADRHPDPHDHPDPEALRDLLQLLKDSYIKEGRQQALSELEQLEPPPP
jgi:hypothetical protein